MCYRVVMFHPDLLKLPRVYGSAGNNIHVWNLAAGSSELHATLNGHHAAVTDLSLTHDQKYMLRYVFYYYLLLVCSSIGQKKCIFCQGIMFLILNMNCRIFCCILIILKKLIYVKKYQIDLLR